MAKRRANGEGSVYKRKSDGKWCAAVTIGFDSEGKPKKKTVYANSKAEAVEKKDALLASIGQIQYLDAEKVTLKEWLVEWFETTAKQRVKGNTYKTYRHTAEKHLYPELGLIKLSKLQSHMIRRFMTEKLNAGLSPAYVNRMYAILHTALRQAVDDGLLPKNPCNAVKKFTVKKKEITVLSMNEVRSLLDAAKENRYYAGFVLGWATGMRRSEICGLRWKDIDFKANTVSINQVVIITDDGLEIGPPKTETSRRTIPIPHEAIKELKTHKAKQAEEILQAGHKYNVNDLVFCDELGNVIDPAIFTDRYVYYAEKAKIANAGGFHTLRHTHATQLLKMGIHPKIVQYRLGHSTMAITMDTYSHVTPDMQDGITDKLSSLLQNQN